MASRQLKEGPTSLTNEFNKKLLEKGGGSAVISAGELPSEAAIYFDNKINNKLAQRPVSGAFPLSSARVKHARNISLQSSESVVKLQAVNS